jgi:hypothetical protein
MATPFDWTRYAVGGAASRKDSFSRLNPDYASRVAQLVQAAERELGPRALTITSAYRSPELQAKMFRDAVAKYGSEKAARKWVAPPGRSKHNAGLAVDFGDANGRLLRDANSREAKWIKENAARFGLDVPMSWEPWQVELAGARMDGGAGAETMAGGSGGDDLSKPAPAAAPEPVDFSDLVDFGDAGDVTEAYASAGAFDDLVDFGDTGQGGAMRGLGLGLRNVAEGAAGALGILSDPIAATMNMAGADIPPLRAAVSGILTELGVPQPETAAERIIGAIQQGATGGAMSAGIGGVAAGAPGMIGQMGRAMASGPVAQVTGGAGAGAGSQIAAEEGAGPLVQAGAGLAGAIIGAAPASMRGPVMAPGAADDVARAQAAGIRPMTSDVFKPETFAGRSVQRIGELVPIAGTGPARAAQQTARIQAVRDLARTYGADASASDDVMKAFLQKRADDLQKYATLKNDVITTVPGRVDVSRTSAEIDAQIAKLTSLKTAEVQPVIAKLTDWRRAIQDQDLVNIDLLRKQIGEAFDAPELAAVRSTGKRALSAIYGPLKSDIGDHIKANGQPRDFTKWGLANARLSSMMDDLDRTSLKSALEKGDVTPEAIRSMLFSQKPSDVRALYKALPPAGRARAQGAVLYEALAKASDGEALSPQKFRSQILKMSNQIGVFFTGNDMKAVDGLRRVLDMTSRAGETAAFGPTGVQTLPVIGGMAITDISGGFGSGVASATALGLMARAYESGATRNMMMKLATTSPGSPEELALVKRIMEAARATQGTQEPDQ